MKLPIAAELRSITIKINSGIFSLNLIFIRIEANRRTIGGELHELIKS